MLTAKRKARAYSDLADRALVAAYLAGDERAFEAIVNRHHRVMRRLAWRYARNEQDAQDIMQEALLKASTHMHTYRAEAKFSTWLYRLVLNAGFDHYKRAENKRQHLSIDDEDLPQDARKFLAHDPLKNFNRMLGLRQTLAALPAENVHALLLIDVAGHSINHAARELGVRPGTVKSRRHRARDMLLDLIEPGD